MLQIGIQVYFTLRDRIVGGFGLAQSGSLDIGGRNRGRAAQVVEPVALESQFQSTFFNHGFAEFRTEAA